MLKKLLIICLSINYIFFCNLYIFAEKTDEEAYNLEDIYYETGLDDLITKYMDNQCLVEEFKNFSHQDMVGKKSKFFCFSPGKMFNIVCEHIKTEIKSPLKLIMGIIGIVLVSAFMEALKVCFSNNSVNEVVNCVCLLSIFIFIAYPLLECVKSAVEVIVNISSFMLGFIPVYAGIMSSCGMVVTSGVYNTFLFCICQVVSEVISQKLLPIVGIYIAFCLVSSIATNLNISEMAKTVKNIITWVLEFIVAAFVGLITIQSVVACSADTVGTKTAKFLIGSAVPIIGGVISDAYTSMKGCFDFVRSSAGAMAIVFVLITCLPILIKLAIWIIMVKFSGGIADFMGIKQVSAILKSSNYAVELLFAIIVSYILLIIITITILLILGLGLN